MLSSLGFADSERRQLLKKQIGDWGAWVAQSVKRLTLDFSSGHDLTVSEFEPYIRLALTVWSARGELEKWRV